MAVIEYGTAWRQQRDVASDDLAGAAHFVSAGLWVLVGEGASGTSGEILTVPTASMNEPAPVFTSQTPAASKALTAAAYSSALGLVVVAGADTIQESANGILYSQVLILGGAVAQGIAAGRNNGVPAHDTFVGVANGLIGSRDDAGTWQLRDVQPELWRAVATNGGASWVVVGGAAASAGRVSTSAFTTSWLTAYDLGGERLNCIEFGNGYYMAAGDAGAVWRTSDLSPNLAGDWVDKAIAATEEDITAIRYLGGSRWILSNADGLWLTENDGDSWALQNTLALGVFGIGGDPTAEVAVAVAAAGDVFVSATETQADAPAPTEPPTVTEPITEIEDVSQRAIDRLAEQFKG